MTHLNNADVTSKSFEVICSCKGCSNTSTIQIQLPINEKLAYIRNICKECLPKFSIPDDNKLDSSKREAQQEKTDYEYY